MLSLKIPAGASVDELIVDGLKQLQSSGKTDVKVKQTNHIDLEAGETRQEIEEIVVTTSKGIKIRMKIVDDRKAITFEILEKPWYIPLAVIEKTMSTLMAEEGLSLA